MSTRSLIDGLTRRRRAERRATLRSLQRFMETAKLGLLQRLKANVAYDTLESIVKNSSMTGQRKQRAFNSYIQRLASSVAEPTAPALSTGG